jgi:hypothetical protein
MSHHFDTKLAKEDPSLNLCDLYLFDGPSGKTVMAMTVNPDVGLSAPDTLHPEGLYAFRFDLNGDAREEVTFKFRFGEPRHVDGSEHIHIQPFVVRKAVGDHALRGDAGESLIEGETGSVATDSDLRAYAGRSLGKQLEEFNLARGEIGPHHALREPRICSLCAPGPSYAGRQ